MKKTFLTAAVLALVAGVALVTWTTAETVATSQSDEVKIAALVHRLDTMGPAGVNALEPLEVAQFEIPGPSVDVMRARMIETYAIEGVGEDTVELTGWIAVKHFNARAVDGSDTVTWDNAVLDTQFVGMDLRGESALFGPVHVELDTERPVQGQVGRIQIPELAQTLLLAANGEEGWSADSESYGEKTEVGSDRGASAPVEPTGPSSGGCSAPTMVRATMPDLQLAMRLAEPVTWYSLVTTIPPVGHTASVTVEPVDLIADGRVVGQLTSGRVLFREVVSRTELGDSVPYSPDRIASH